ncbi:DUF1643 domain-containing protein [Bacillus gobiensis]|uniref:DUF1643 domain-containing protein n=1 Tax=Bacillus gobiensis TaxID=1441095 RepID=UPI003D25803F
MVEIHQNMTMLAVLSDNHKYRYYYEKTWNKYRPCACVILLHPSLDDVLKSDKTVTSLTNYFIDQHYGKFIVVNLFAYMTSDSSELKKSEQSYEQVNRSYFEKACAGSDMIFIGWGSDTKKFVSAKRAAEEILVPYKSKLKCFVDDRGKFPRHPRDLNERLSIEEYHFFYI